MLNGSIYERELVSILSGKKESIKRLARKLDYEKRASLESLIKSPFYVTRSAGSKGADIVAVRYDISMIIEVKSSSSDNLTFSSSSGKNQDQALKLSKMCEDAGLFLIYAFRLKNATDDPWRIFSIPGEPRGRFRSLYSIIPNVKITKNNNYIMQWEEGLPLHRMISFFENLQSL
ncbi:MAG: hypothetical protein AMDU2_EPLC00012G0074 [Thermoplasmatales archaeon E-plasma]|nr:MAG: hypothetical protein AMDU2_EPLC00012G0074 [Thermoplasmatales archaeon E-plasma]